MSNWVKLALAVFAKNITTGDTEQVGKSNDARNALQVEDQHQQGLTSVQLTAAGLATEQGLVSIYNRQLVILQQLQVLLTGDQFNAKQDVQASTRASEATVAGRFAPVKNAQGDFNTTGTHDLVDPGAGNKVAPIWLFAQATAALDTGAVEVTFRMGLKTLYTLELTGSQPFAHALVPDVTQWGIGDKLTVSLNAAARVLFNADYRITN